MDPQALEVWRWAHARTVRLQAMWDEGRADVAGGADGNVIEPTASSISVIASGIGAAAASAICDTAVCLGTAVACTASVLWSAVGATERILSTPVPPTCSCGTTVPLWVYLLFTWWGHFPSCHNSCSSRHSMTVEVCAGPSHPTLVLPASPSAVTGHAMPSHRRHDQLEEQQWEMQRVLWPADRPPMTADEDAVAEARAAAAARWRRAAVWVCCASLMGVSAAVVVGAAVMVGAAAVADAGSQSTRHYSYHIHYGGPSSSARW